MAAGTVRRQLWYHKRTMYETAAAPAVTSRRRHEHQLRRSLLHPKPTFERGRQFRFGHAPQQGAGQPAENEGVFMRECGIVLAEERRGVEGVRGGGGAKRRAWRL
jgi:hypothetical protein